MEPFQLFFAFQLRSKYETSIRVCTYRYYYNTRFVHTIRYYAVGSHARPAQISPAIYGPAAHRSAVRRRAVRCRALRCGAVSLRCVLSFEHRAVPGIMRVVYGVLLFIFLLFLHDIRMYLFDLSPPPVFLPHANYPRTADQNVTPVTKAHTAQLSTTWQFALHKTSSSWHYQIAVRTKSRASFFCPLYIYVFSCIFPCLARA